MLGLSTGENVCYVPSMENESDVQLALRVGKPLYAKILDRQKEAKKLTGIEPSVSAVVRAMLEEAAEKNGKKR